MTSDGHNLLEQQTREAIEWLASNQALALATKLVRRYRLMIDPRDLLSEAVLKVRDGMSRRASPLVGKDVQSLAVRYASRSVSNLAIDFSRRRTVEDRQAVELARTLPDMVGPERQVEASVFIEQLNSSVNELMRTGPSCPGCHREVVFAAATEVMQLVLIEGATDDGGSRGDDWFDDAIVNVIDRMSKGASLRPDARRKRRHRCKECVMQLLQAGLRQIGYRRG